MGRRPLFSVAGIPVRIQPFFFLVILFLGLGYPFEYLLTWMVIATLSILLHEFGHAVAFRFYGMQPSVTLHGLGGLTTAALPPARPDGRPGFTPGQRVVVSLAGPLSALVLLGLPALIIAQQNGFEPLAALGYGQLRWIRPDPAELILSQIIWVNVGWSLLNLLPVLPLDGGNVTLAAIEALTRDNARRIGNYVSIGVAGIGALIALATGYEFLLILLGLLAAVNVAELLRRPDPPGLDELAAAQQALLAYRPADAERLAWEVLAHSPAPDLSRWATELVAWARLAQGDVARAEQVARSLPNPPGATPSLRGALALAGGSSSEGVSISAWAQANDPMTPARTLGAIAIAQTGHVGAVATELSLMGPAGVAAARGFAERLTEVGFRDQAGEVERILAPAVQQPPGWG